jgi:hypothetical protein
MIVLYLNAFLFEKLLYVEGGSYGDASYVPVAPLTLLHPPFENYVCLQPFVLAPLA